MCTNLWKERVWCSSGGRNSSNGDSGNGEIIGRIELKVTKLISWTSVYTSTLNWYWHSVVAIWEPLFASRIISGSLLQKLRTFLRCRLPPVATAICVFPWMKFIESRRFLLRPLRHRREGSMSMWVVVGMWGCVTTDDENADTDVASNLLKWTSTLKHKLVSG